MSHRQSPSTTVYAVGRWTESPLELGRGSGVDMARVEGRGEGREESMSEKGVDGEVKERVDGSVCRGMDGGICSTPETWSSFGAGAGAGG